MKKTTILLIIMMMAISASAQVGIRPAAFNVDFASFASDSAGYNLFEVYFQVYSSHLLYIREEGKYMGKYSITAVIKEGGKQVAAKEYEETVFAENYDEAHSPKSYIVNAFQFYIKPGRYKVEVTLNDINASSSIPLETSMELPEYTDDRPMISQIEFARDIYDVEEPTVFDKGNWRIVPSCSRRYGEGMSRLKFYFELYNGRLIHKDELEFIYEIRDRKNKVVLSGSAIKLNGESNQYVDSLQLSNFKPGEHSLVIYTRDSDDKLVSRIGSFTVHWTAQELVENDFGSAIQQLRYIANSKEIKQLKKADKESRLEEWNKFWKSKDPSPDTDINELKDEYYRRISYSNHQYNLPNKPGWLTDMGMIHVINGKPDDIDRHPFDIETKPYEIWYYYNPRRRFLFIDVNGYGEYILQYPYDGDVNKRINIYGGGP